MKLFKVFFLALIVALTVSPDIQAQIFKKKEKKTEKKENGDKKAKMKPYNKVITKEAKTQKGLFAVHQVDEDWYFELADSILEKEILVTSRISGFVKGLNFGGAGIKSKPQQVIRWQKKGKKILLRSVSYNSVASFEDPIYESVRNNV